MHHTAKLEKNPPPRSPARGSATSTTTACRSSGVHGLTVSLTSGRRRGSSGTPWSRTSAPLPLADARCSCATDGEPAGGVSEDRCRAGPRRAQDLTGPSWWNSWWMRPCQSWSSWHAARAHLNCCSGEELLVADGYAQHQEGPPADIHRQRRAVYKNSARS